MKEGIPAGVEGGGQTTWMMITLLRKTADAVGEWNLVGHISTACLPPSLPHSPPFNYNKKKIVSVRIACVSIIFSNPIFLVLFLKSLKKRFPSANIHIIFLTVELHSHVSSWLVYCHINLCCSCESHTLALNLLLWFFHSGYSTLLDPGRGWGRDYSLSIIHFYWHECFYGIATDFKLQGTKILYGTLPCNSQARFLLDVNNYSAIVTLPFLKHSAGSVPS